MSDPVSALGGAVATDGLSIRLEEIGSQGMVTLRGDPASQVWRRSVEAAATTPLPDIRKVVIRGARTLCWMAPDEALLVLPYGEAGAVVAALDEGLAGEHHLAVDVSDARTLLRLTGDNAREVIAKGAPVDLSRAAFGPGDLRRTRLGQVAVAFWQVSEAPDVFHLICFRSVAAHVFDWLRVSAREGAEIGHL